MAFNINELKQIEKDLKKQIGYCKELWGQNDPRFYNLCNIINNLQILLKELENETKRTNMQRL